jgi:hypothetical protein
MENQNPAEMKVVAKALAPKEWACLTEMLKRESTIFLFIEVEEVGSTLDSGTKNPASGFNSTSMLMVLM